MFRWLDEQTHRVPNRLCDAPDALFARQGAMQKKLAQRVT